jgi:pyruvate/2-oxoglutarate dehydrogenase complex dihydrolipoamide dehydrogenase (E3) component
VNASNSRPTASCLPRVRSRPPKISDSIKLEWPLDHGIITDETLRTTVPNIWAAGDVHRGAHQLTMVAQHEGKIAAYNALHKPPKPVDEKIVPWMIGTSPPIAGVGMIVPLLGAVAGRASQTATRIRLDVPARGVASACVTRYDF